VADATNRRVALVSIHPRFAEAILRGEKLVEFRRRGPSPATSHVIVYATAPVQRIVGWFQVRDVASGTPKSLWNRFGSIGGIGSAEFDRYYEACQVGTAIAVGDVIRADPPATLQAIGTTTAPQSFRYVDWTAFEDLRASANHAAVSTA
jgi:predicted transcriptional regulator